MGAKTHNKEELRGQAAKRLKKVLQGARTQCKLTQEDVAERIGVDPEVYGRFERGALVPRVRTLKKLALALGISADRLLGLDVPGEEPRIVVPPEDSLPLETRRVLRAVRKLRPDQIRILTTIACALMDAKGKRSEARERATQERREGGRRHLAEDNR